MMRVAIMGHVLMMRFRLRIWRFLLFLLMLFFEDSVGDGKALQPKGTLLVQGLF